MFITKHLIDMAKKNIRLTEQEFRTFIKHAVNETLSEIDGATYARIHNATMRAQQNQLLNKTSESPKRTNLELILKGIELNPKTADSLITPYKTDYLFHCQNLRGTAAITIFHLDELYELTPQKAILKGNIVFNGERLWGSIIVDMTNHSVCYNYKGRSPRYTLQIDPSKKDLWDRLIQQLDLALQKHNI